MAKVTIEAKDIADAEKKFKVFLEEALKNKPDITLNDVTVILDGESGNLKQVLVNSQEKNS